MLTIQENALDSRNCGLVVLCLPSLFPTGQFGQYHPRQIKIQLSENVKSCLLTDFEKMQNLFSTTCSLKKWMSCHLEYTIH